MGTMILQNNQFKLTRVLQALLHTSSKILDIAQQDDRLFFLYDSLELQEYSLSSHSWKSYHRIPLFSIIISLNSRPDAYHSSIPVQSAIMTSCDSYLCISLNSGFEVNQ